jgi:hypothetical protein
MILRKKGYTFTLLAGNVPRKPRPQGGVKGHRIK